MTATWCELWTPPGGHGCGWGVGAKARRAHLQVIKTNAHTRQNRHGPRQHRCDGESLMINESMVKITNLGPDDPALPKPNPPPPTRVPATETDLQLVVKEDPPDSPQVQAERLNQDTSAQRNRAWAAEGQDRVR